MNETKSTNMEEIGGMLKRIMKKRGISLSDMAKKTGINEEKLKSIIDGCISPTIDEMMKISCVTVDPTNSKQIEKECSEFFSQIK